MSADGGRVSTTQLTVFDHDRSVAGYQLVYPVLSRRSRGLSVGINLNHNNACNWRCVYCQVPNLQRGAAPKLDLELLETELGLLLSEVQDGTFFARYLGGQSVPIRDLAVSGNGEPTTCREFEQAIELLGRIRNEREVLRGSQLVVISNGSLVGRSWVDPGLLRLASLSGELWFKLDSGTSEGLRTTNGTGLSIERHLGRLERCASLCPTWIQSCWFRRDGVLPLPSDRQAYLDVLRSVQQRKVGIRGVQLYSLARPPQRPEGAILSAVDGIWLTELAEDIRRLGLKVLVAD